MSLPYKQLLLLSRVKEQIYRCYRCYSFIRSIQYNHNCLPVPDPSYTIYTSLSMTLSSCFQATITNTYNLPLAD